MDEAHRKLRRDHRKGTDLRPIDISLNYLRRADGSARLAQGNTTVICAAHGPMACSRRDQELVDRGFLEVVFKPADDRPGSMKAHRANMHTQRSCAYTHACTHA